MLLVNGEVAGITDIDSSTSPDDVTVSPALTTAPLAAAVVSGGVNYKPQDILNASLSAYRSHTWDIYTGVGVRHILNGWKTNIKTALYLTKGIDGRDAPPTSRASVKMFQA